jgi:hypothetical protein
MAKTTDDSHETHERTRKLKIGWAVQRSGLKKPNDTYQTDVTIKPLNPGP